MDQLTNLPNNNWRPINNVLVATIKVANSEETTKSIKNTIMKKEKESGNETTIPFKLDNIPIIYLGENIDFFVKNQYTVTLGKLNINRKFLILLFAKFWKSRQKKEK